MRKSAPDKRLESGDVKDTYAAVLQGDGTCTLKGFQLGAQALPRNAKHVSDVGLSETKVYDVICIGKWPTQSNQSKQNVRYTPERRERRLGAHIAVKQACAPGEVQQKAKREIAVRPYCVQEGLARDDQDGGVFTGARGVKGGLAIQRRHNPEGLPPAEARKHVPAAGVPRNSQLQFARVDDDHTGMGGAVLGDQLALVYPYQARGCDEFFYPCGRKARKRPHQPDRIEYILPWIHVEVYAACSRNSTEGHQDFTAVSACNETGAQSRPSCRPQPASSSAFRATGLARPESQALRLPLRTSSWSRKRSS